MSLMASWLWCAKYAAVAHALKRTGGNRTHAARLLGVSRNYLLKLLADVRGKPPA